VVIIAAIGVRQVVIAVAGREHLPDAIAASVGRNDILDQPGRAIRLVDVAITVAITVVGRVLIERTEIGRSVGIVRIIGLHLLPDQRRAEQWDDRRNQVIAAVDTVNIAAAVTVIEIVVVVIEAANRA